MSLEVQKGPRWPILSWIQLPVPNAKGFFVKDSVHKLSVKLHDEKPQPCHCWIYILTVKGNLLSKNNTAPITLCHLLFQVKHSI